MRRIDVRYGGEHYSIADRHIDDVRAEIVDALRAGEPRWLNANYGAGSVRNAQLLISAGIGISLMPIESD